MLAVLMPGRGRRSRRLAPSLEGLEGLPWPVADSLLKSLDAVSVLRLGSTSRAFSRQISQAWNLNSLLSRFVRHVSAFRRKLATVGAVIGGGLPTQFFAREYWPASDVDIFIGDHVWHERSLRSGLNRYPYRLFGRRLAVLRSFLVDHEGYEPYEPSEPYGHRSPSFLSLRKSNKVVQIIGVNCSGVSLSPEIGVIEVLIRRFYGTHVMNFITADMALSLFPRTTFERREMFLVRDGMDRTGDPTLDSELSAVAKYRSRGWRVSSFAGDELSSLRSLFDAKCWVMHFGRDGSVVARSGKPSCDVRFALGEDGVVRLRDLNVDRS